MTLISSDDQQSASPASHGGLLFPLDMFRPTMLAKVIGDYFVSKARNVLDAQMVLTRHPRTQLCSLKIAGSVLDGDQGKFWRDNSDLVLLFSRILPRQAFLYYVQYVPERREGLIIAQQGQSLMADEVTRDRLPPDATEADWPLARLCEQLGSSVEELASGFAGGPRIEVALIDGVGDDRELLSVLVTPPAGAAPEELAEEAPAEEYLDDGAQFVDAWMEGDPEPGTAPVAAAPTPMPAAAAPAPAAKAAAPAAKKAPAVDDQKRRAQEKSAEQAAIMQAQRDAANQLVYVIDEHGVVVAPPVALEHFELLKQYVVRSVHGDIPSGIPTELGVSLQGKRVDFVVPVEFLSEVFHDQSPLNRPAFEAKAQPLQLLDLQVSALEVFAPRLGAGILLRHAGKNLFITRVDLALPEALIRQLFANMG